MRRSQPRGTLPRVPAPPAHQPLPQNQFVVIPGPGLAFPATHVDVRSAGLFVISTFFFDGAEQVMALEVVMTPAAAAPCSKLPAELAKNSENMLATLSQEPDLLGGPGNDKRVVYLEPVPAILCGAIEIIEYELVQLTFSYPKGQVAHGAVGPPMAVVASAEIAIPSALFVSWCLRMGNCAQKG